MTEALNDNKFDELANTIKTQGYRVIEAIDVAHEMDSAAKDDLIVKMADLHSTMTMLETHIHDEACNWRVDEARAKLITRRASVSLSRHAAADLTRKTTDSKSSAVLLLALYDDAVRARKGASVSLSRHSAADLTRKTD